MRGGMTQEQLAEASGVSVGVVRKLERGGSASLPSLLSIADALGTDIVVRSSAPSSVEPTPPATRP
ncbi:helix-turn-helix domain-containing protein [Streptomyces sp. NPDC058495]